MRVCSLLLASLTLLACGDDSAKGDAAADMGMPLCECNDGVFCNGEERCDSDDPAADVRGCVAGMPPCQSSGCDEVTDECVAVSECLDEDGDGAMDVACGGSDCDDSDPDRFPGNTEVCDVEGVDEDCDPTTLGPDEDNDGFVDAECCNGDRCGRDCNDSVGGVNPNAVDGCGGGDEDCDGDLDEEPDALFYRDFDNDTYGDDTDTLMACALPNGYAARGGDCNDDPFASGVPANEINPGATETCDEIDNDCDGTIDERGMDAPCACTTPGSERACGLTDPARDGVGICVSGIQRCTDGAWTSCIGAVNPAVETCNEQDSDCDGTVDEGTFVTCFTDADNDGVPPTGATPNKVCGIACPPGTTSTDPATLSAHDCDDNDVERSPELMENCDAGNKDEDCDGMENEGCSCVSGTIESCADAGNVGICAQGTRQCNSGMWSACPSPQSETCNGDDDDCDTRTDEDFPTQGASCVPSSGLSTCPCFGTIQCIGHEPTCVSTVQSESCDGRDNDCDTRCDEAAPPWEMAAEVTGGACYRRINVRGEWSDWAYLSFHFPGLWGDTEFGADGPVMSTRMSLSASASQNIGWQISLAGEETNSDWTIGINQGAGTEVVHSTYEGRIVDVLRTQFLGNYYPVTCAHERLLGEPAGNPQGGLGNYTPFYTDTDSALDSGTAAHTLECSLGFRYECYGQTSGVDVGSSGQSRCRFRTPLLGWDLWVEIEP